MSGAERRDIGRDVEVGRRPWCGAPLAPPESSSIPVVIVSEEQIADAMRQFIDLQHQLLEGAAGVAVAGLLAEAAHFADKNVVVLVCGGNVSRDTLKSVI